MSARSSPAKRLVNSCVCSVGRGFQAADSPVCYMLICCKNLKSLGGSSSILLDCPVHVSVQADAQRPLVPEYGGFLSSSSTSPHYFLHKLSPTQQNLQPCPSPSHVQTRARAAASALESPVSPHPHPRLAKTSPCVRAEKATAPRQGDAWAMPGREDTAGSLLLSFSLFLWQSIFRDARISNTCFG